MKTFYVIATEDDNAVIVHNNTALVTALKEAQDPAKIFLIDPQGRYSEDISEFCAVDWLNDIDGNDFIWDDGETINAEMIPNFIKINLTDYAEYVQEIANDIRGNMNHAKEMAVPR